MASGLPSLPPAFAQGLVLIDEAHSQDPNKIDGPDGPKTLPYELHYARKMTRWLEARCPDASPELQLACRAQHFKRWELPRSAFPMTRPGYLTWRAKQKTQAATQVASLLASASVSPPLPEEARARIAALVRKESLATDAETQALEDVACLVFLDDQFDDFEAKADIDEDKVVGILRKTWAKMSEPGRALALGMDLSERAKLLIGRALEPQDAAA
ncbi:glutamyl-tRNA synthetase [Purpureocillium lilacinum]|uniref:Glutamyl-tRNA synthetase n=1 Tax=Purpureocillium lilacinum TaxID=33203 RepID=A0A179H7C8_PURLI|nr:glutamyl-tRNA synthetase [Purpureocillium lilacinum]OAQ85339.1 glutamyl-tRNA synthetase [Purpureocillium lilacinum]